MSDAYGLMFVTPTPANTPHITASATSSPAEHIVIDVAATNQAEQSMPVLALAPSVQKAMRKKLGESFQRNTMPRNFGAGNVAKLPSALESLKL